MECFLHISYRKRQLRRAFLPLLFHEPQEMRMLPLLTALKKKTPRPNIEQALDAAQMAARRRTLGP